MYTKILSALVALCCFMFPHLVALNVAGRTVLAPAPAETGPDRIHFLSTGSSDAILLESDGHFAMVDAGEDTDNPRGFDALDLPGYEQEVLSYLKANAADENGKVHLDFVLGTHAHSDHIGGFDTILRDPAVTVDRAYLKVYDSSRINTFEIEAWDNQEVYDQMLSALREKNVPVIAPDGTPFAFGNFTVKLFNTDDPENPDRVGENDQSLGVLLEKNGTRVFLAGDMDDLTGDETRLAPAIGKVDLLKVGHHSYAGSTSVGFVKTLCPSACVITNARNNADVNTVARIAHYARHNRIYVTGNEHGVLAVIGDGGEIAFYGRICGWEQK